MDAAPQLAGAVEGDVVELLTVLSQARNFPLRPDPLDAAVLAVRDIDVAVGTDGDPVHYTEFTGARASLAPSDFAMQVSAHKRPFWHQRRGTIEREARAPRHMDVR